MMNCQFRRWDVTSRAWFEQGRKKLCWTRSNKYLLAASQRKRLWESSTVGSNYLMGDLLLFRFLQMDMEDTSLEGKRESPYRPSPDRTAKITKRTKSEERVEAIKTDALMDPDKKIAGLIEDLCELSDDLTQQQLVIRYNGSFTWPRMDQCNRYRRISAPIWLKAYQTVRENIRMHKRSMIKITALTSISTKCSEPWTQKRYGENLLLQPHEIHDMHDMFFLVQTH